VKASQRKHACQAGGHGYGEEYMDCLRLLTRERDAKPFIKAMAHSHPWTAGFDYEDIADTLERMKDCNAFEKSRVQIKIPAASCGVSGADKTMRLTGVRHEMKAIGV